MASHTQHELLIFSRISYTPKANRVQFQKIETGDDCPCTRSHTSKHESVPKIKKTHHNVLPDVGTCEQIEAHSPRKRITSSTGQVSDLVFRSRTIEMNLFQNQTAVMSVRLTSDVSRALVHIVTCGAEGKSPFFVSDIIQELSTRHSTVSILTLSETPLDMTLEIDGVRVRLWVGDPSEHSASEIVGYAATTSEGSIRFNMMKTLKNVTVDTMNKKVVQDKLLNPLHEDWYSRWPDWNEWQDFKVKHLVSRRRTRVPTMKYVSEHLCVSAIDHAIASLTIW